MTAAVVNWRRPFNVASPDCAEAFFAGATVRCEPLRLAGALSELRTVLEGHLADHDRSPAPLDLIGHSIRDHHLLRLGTTPIDMLDRRVARFFGVLAASCP
ncbi:MAG TPA: hypothetical protein VIY28_02210 [Pseudonocardiaceae bacterium]